MSKSSAQTKMKALVAARQMSDTVFIKVDSTLGSLADSIEMGTIGVEK